MRGAVYSLFVKQGTYNLLWRKPPPSPEPQKPQPPIAEIVLDLQQQPLEASRRNPLSTSEKLWLAGTLMQFGDFNPVPAKMLATPWHHLEALHAEMVQRGKTAPLSFSEQFAIATRQADGVVGEALWRLFLASRHFARWSDSVLILDAPTLSDGEKVVLMQSWERAVAACKPAEDLRRQDVAGDTYYAWTHALARVSFNQPDGGILDRGLALTFARGTTLMQLLINHRFNPIGPGGTESDHKRAERYGNAIGRALTPH